MHCLNINLVKMNNLECFQTRSTVYATQKKGLGFRMPENTKYQRRFEPYEKELIEIRHHLHRLPGWACRNLRPRRLSVIIWKNWAID